MSTPRVSIIIPTYNRSALLVETLESVFAQTCQDFEIIVVNDGSTDDTAAVLGKYGARLHCVHQANAGLNAARNAALKIARGEFFALLDDDDLWEPHKLELSLALADRFPRAAFVFSNFSILRDGQKISRDGLHTWHPTTQWHEIFVHRHRFSAADLDIAAQPAGQIEDREFDVYEGDVYDASLEGPWVLPAASLVRRSAVPAGLEFCAQDPTCGDWEYFARLSKHGGALFVDLDIAINRSHETAGRLTRMPRQLQLARRAAMTERVWLADDEYLGHSGERARATLHGCLTRLARAQLLAGNAVAAREALGRAAALGEHRTAAEWMTYCAAHIPGSGPSLRALRRLMLARG
jgi:GT2 family glycosyltransferase